MQHDIEELIKKLHDIASRSPKTKEEMQLVEAECIELMQQIKNLNLGNTCPDEVWHYLTDADIRFKDPEYAKYQLIKYLSALKGWQYAT